MNIQGHVEYFHPASLSGWSVSHVIGGWVADLDALDNPQEVYLRVGGTNVSYAVASEFGVDLQRSLGGSGRYRFRIPVTTDMFSRLKALDFEVVCPRNNQPLPILLTFSVGRRRTPHAQPDESVQALKRQIAYIIKEFLASDYQSFSPTDRILTGNRYQTIDLGDERVGGFRGPDRSYAFVGYDVVGKVCADLGCNFGEVVRMLAQQGAESVLGVEYDNVFLTISRLLDALHGSEGIRYLQGDLTQDDVLAPVDLFICLSVYRFIAGRLKELASKTRELLIMETHAVKDWNDEAPYVRALQAFFPFVCIIGYSDSGTSEGRRAIVWCAKEREVIYKYLFQRSAALAGHSSILTLDLAKSRIPATQAAASIEVLRGLNSSNTESYLPDLDAQVAPVAAWVSSNTSAVFGDNIYWNAFAVGFLQWLRDHHEVKDDNVYFNILKKVLGSDHNYDRFIGGRDAENLVCRVLWRFTACLDLVRDRDPKPVSIFQTFEVNNGDVRISMTDGTSFMTTEVDGYHRIAASVLLGKTDIPCIVYRKNWAPLPVNSFFTV